MDGPCDYGHFDIVLADFLKKNSVSKNQLSEKANLQRTQLNSYCKNNIKRPDLDVLARICYALDCELDLSARSRKKAFLKKAERHILQQGSILGEFE